jgi:hypothetical protein
MGCKGGKVAAALWRKWRTEETERPLRSLADTHSPHSDTSSTNNSRRNSSSHHDPELINRAKDVPHTRTGRGIEPQPPLHPIQLEPHQQLLQRQSLQRLVAHSELPRPPVQLHEYST